MADWISNIYLCSVDITPTHQLDFESIDKQNEYFNSKVLHTFTNCKYTPRTSKIRVSGYVENLSNCNYGFYKNIYNGITKTFYFWIVQKQAVNKKTTELTIQLDVFQTWLFDFRLNNCFIERQHVSNDAIGANTFPEDFELGDYITVSTQSINEMTSGVCYLLAITDSENSNIGGVYSGVYSGFKLLYYKGTDTDLLTSKINSLAEAGKADAIAFIAMFPSGFLADKGLSSGSGIPYNIGLLSTTKEINIAKKFTFKNRTFTPRNNKLLTYPYTMLTVYTPSGGNAVYKIEHFDDIEHIRFKVETSVTQNPTFSLSPKDYENFGYVNNGSSFTYEHFTNIPNTIDMNCYGLCSWNNDNYGNWYAQHQNSLTTQSSNAYASYRANKQVYVNNYTTGMDNMSRSANAQLAGLAISGTTNALSNPFNAIGTLGNTVSGGINIATNAENTANSLGNDLGNSNLLNSVNYSNTINSIMASIHDASVQPNTAKGDTSASGLDVARGTSSFYINQVSIKPEYAEKIDMFFQMYGYQVNVVETPNFKTREKWNYLKTVGCNVTGNIPLEDRNAIAGLFDNGLTIWHNDSYMYLYTQDNPIK